jgi:hypothetical protein
MNFATDEFYEEECVGCGRSSNQIIQEDEVSPVELEVYSVYTDSGHWYCHRDCLRDSL